LFVAYLALTGARAADVDLEKAVGSLIAAEEAYANPAAEKGFRERSISTFAEDAVIFERNAVNGKKPWRRQRGTYVCVWRLEPDGAWKFARVRQTILSGLLSV
jgi:hypothetical protein